MVICLLSLEQSLFERSVRHGCQITQWRAKLHDAAMFQYLDVRKNGSFLDFYGREESSPRHIQDHQHTGRHQYYAQRRMMHG